MSACELLGRPRPRSRPASSIGSNGVMPALTAAATLRRRRGRVAVYPETRDRRLPRPFPRSLRPPAAVASGHRRRACARAVARAWARCARRPGRCSCRRPFGPARGRHVPCVAPVADLRARSAGSCHRREIRTSVAAVCHTGVDRHGRARIAVGARRRSTAAAAAIAASAQQRRRILRSRRRSPVRGARASCSSRRE